MKRLRHGGVKQNCFTPYKTIRRSEKCRTCVVRSDFPYRFSRKDLLSLDLA